MAKRYSEKDLSRFLGQSDALLKGDMTLRSVYAHIFPRHAKKTASIYFDEDARTKSLTYREQDLRIQRIARHLKGAFMDAKPGSIVALKMRNSENWPVLFWAILRSGFRILLVDARLPKENTQNLLSQSGAIGILASEEASYSVPLLRLNDIISSPEKELSDADVWGDEIFFCSSGTTGAVKMLGMSGKNAIYQILSAKALAKRNGIIMNPGPMRNLAMIPFHHVFGFFAVFFWYSFYGKTLVFPDSMSSKDILWAVNKGKVTHLYSVPLFWDSIAQAVRRSFALKGPKREDFLNRFLRFNNGEIGSKEAKHASSPILGKLVRKKVLGNRIRWCISGGGYLSRATLELVNGLGYPLANGYGMTELGIVAVETEPDPQTRLLGSVGMPFMGYETKLDRKDPSLPEGELLVKTPVCHEEEIIGGVWRKTPLDAGYFHTGDIATIDQDGRIYIKGRMKDTIIASNGENVYPDEIETYFASLPHVLSLAVIGMPKGASEEIVLVLDVDNSATEEDLKAIKAEIEKRNLSLPNEKKVSESYVYYASLPTANNMKVKRFTLRQELSKYPSHFYSLDEKKEPIESSLRKYPKEEVEETIATIKQIFAKTLLLPAFKIDEKAIWNKELGGDSMSYVAMVSDLNDAFHLEIPTEYYGKVGSVQGFAELILSLKHPEESVQKGLDTPSQQG